VSTGVPNLDMALPEKGVIYRSVSVVTREGFQTIRWDYITDLSLGRPTQPIFTTYIDESNITHIVFGDNAAGRIPSVNAEIFATYRFGVGAAANVLEANSIDTLIPPPDIEGLELITVWNEASPVGGADPESIESMKHSIPRSAGRIKHRAVTLNDYADLALQVPGVAKSVAYGTVYTAVRVKFALATPNGEAAPEVMTRYCREIEAYMQDKVLIGSTVYAEPENPDDLWSTPTDGTAEIYMRVLVHVVETYNRTAVREQVETVLRKLLDYTTVSFGTRISIGSVYRTILGVQGVEWAELKWLSTNAPPQEIPDIPDNGGTTGLFTGNWRYDTSTTIADPGTGDFRFDNATDATHIAIAKLTHNSVDRGANLMGLEIGDQILTRPTADTNSWRAYIVDENPIDNTTWVDLTVHKANEADSVIIPGNNSVMLFDFFRPNPAPGLILEVYDIHTPELLIPRIEPTVVVEEITQFPDMSEDERTHDGLWIWAVGGLANS
jgi:baseplate J-like protein